MQLLVEWRTKYLVIALARSATGISFGTATSAEP